ncbi:MAG: Na+/H+ antiporter NhaA [Bacteroidaceae bacterium]|nr:Na+/H+ antiporter NhaA [Bacteroidaceae bacterium]
MINYSFMSMLKKYASASVFLILCTVLALICANSSAKEWYFDLWQNTMSISIGSFNLFSHNGHAMTVLQVINDFLMALFFLSVGLEIKREFLVGELSSPKKAMLPIIGACGGMLFPVIVFWLLCPDNADMQRGLAIPMATDIAFSLGVLSAFSSRVPTGLKIFLAALAVADDLGGIIVIALFYSSDLHTNFLLLSLLCVVVMMVANKMKVHNKFFYLLTGLVLWYTMLNSGIHATIAGVITAFCVPCTLQKGTGFYLNRIRENLNGFPVIDSDKKGAFILSHEEINKLKSIESAADKLISPLQDLEDNLHALIGYVVIPIFAFANIGIDFSTMSIDNLFQGVGLSVMAGLVIGKFVGVLLFSWVAVKCGIVTLPQGSNWKSFSGVSMLCGIGLTVSIFIADLSYSSLPEVGTMLLGQAKLGILCGSFISAIIGCILLNIFLPKKK